MGRVHHGDRRDLRGKVWSMEEGHRLGLGLGGIFGGGGRGGWLYKE